MLQVRPQMSETSRYATVKVMTNERDVLLRNSESHDKRAKHLATRAFFFQPKTKRMSLRSCPQGAILLQFSARRSHPKAAHSGVTAAPQRRKNVTSILTADGAPQSS